MPGLSVCRQRPYTAQTIGLFLLGERLKAGTRCVIFAVPSLTQEVLWKERKEKPQRKDILVAFAGRWRHLVVITGSGKSAETSPGPSPGSLAASSFLPAPLGRRPRPAPQLCLVLGPWSSVPFQLASSVVRSGSSAPPGDKPRPLASRMPRTRCASLTLVFHQDTCPRLPVVS